jgi:hypothetical protein
LRLGAGIVRADIEIPSSGLVTAELAAEIAGVTVSAIRVWKHRGRLDIARDIDGRPFRNEQGRQLFDFMAVIDAEYKTRAKTKRGPLRCAA